MIWVSAPLPVVTVGAVFAAHAVWLAGRARQRRHDVVSALSFFARNASCTDVVTEHLFDEVGR